MKTIINLNLKPGQPYRLAQSLKPRFLSFSKGTVCFNVDHSLDFTHFYHPPSTLALRDLNNGFLATVPQWRKMTEKEISKTHRFFQARVSQNVSCLCQQWSAPEGCDCSAFSRSDGGVSSAWLPALCRAGPPSADPMPPCCLLTCLNCTKSNTRCYIWSYVWSIENYTTREINNYLLYFSHTCLHNAI